MVRYNKLIYLTLFLLLAFVSVGFMLFPDHLGYDFSVYCAAGQAYHEGANPYDANILASYNCGIPLPYTYPPLSILFFDTICKNPFANAVESYHVLYLLLLGIAIGVMFLADRKNFDYALILMLSGFLAVAWSFSTGNIGGMLFLPCIALAYHFFRQEKYYLSSFCIGVMSILTLFPVLFSFLFLLVNRSLVERVRIVMTAIGTLATWLLLSLLFSPYYFWLYVGGLTGDGSVAYEPGGFYTNTFYLLIDDLVQSSLAYYGLSIAYVAFVGAVFYLFFIANRDKLLQVFSFGFMGIFLVLPRLKPYYFTLILIPIYFLLKDSSYRVKTVSLVIISAIPIPCLFLYQTVPHLLILYGDTLCAIAAYIFIFLLYRKQQP